MQALGFRLIGIVNMTLKSELIIKPLSLKARLARLEVLLRGMGRVAIGFSGGVDSAFIAATALRVLGPENVLAITADSLLQPRREMTGAAALARTLGLRLEMLHVRIQSRPEILRNMPDRCYHCKLAVFRAIRKIAGAQGIAHVLDGSNTDDLCDVRPGARALQELGVLSPLMDAGLGKSDIRRASRQMGLPVADKPAAACLASRIPYGVRLTADRLAAVERAEAAVAALGFEGARVRAHGDVARIELAPGDAQRALSGKVRGALARGVHRSGFRYVALDLDGYRTGSLNAGKSLGTHGNRRETEVNRKKNS